LKTARPISRTFLATAGAAGAVYGNFAVALPLYGTAIGLPVSIIGVLLAIATLAVAVGSTLAGLAVRVMSASSLLALGMATAGAGDAILIFGSLPALFLGSLLVGSGLGLYWAGSQAVLGSLAGRQSSERAFINQFVVYTLGTVAGSVVTGGISNVLHLAGLSAAATGRGAFCVGLMGAGAALALDWLRPRFAGRASRIATISGGAGRDAILQLSDLCLVAALAFILALAPVVLETHFGFDSLQVGISYGAVSLAKMAGSFLAGRAVGRVGHRRTIILMIGAGGVLSLLLAAVNVPVVFVLLLTAATLTAGGVWPVLVDATLATVHPHRRAAMALTWSAREYPVIALATLLGGWLLATFRNPALLYLATATLLAGSVAASRLLVGPTLQADAL
jgi:MFS family permease